MAGRFKKLIKGASSGKKSIAFFRQQSDHLQMTSGLNPRGCRLETVKEAGRNRRGCGSGVMEEKEPKTSIDIKTH